MAFSTPSSPRKQENEKSKGIKEIYDVFLCALTTAPEVKVINTIIDWTNIDVNTLIVCTIFFAREVSDDSKLWLYFSILYIVIFWVPIQPPKHVLDAQIYGIIIICSAHMYKQLLQIVLNLSPVYRDFIISFNRFIVHFGCACDWPRKIDWNSISNGFGYSNSFAPSTSIRDGRIWFCYFAAWLAKCSCSPPTLEFSEVQNFRVFQCTLYNYSYIRPAAYWNIRVDILCRGHSNDFATPNFEDVSEKRYIQSIPHRLQFYLMKT